MKVIGCKVESVGQCHAVLTYRGRDADTQPPFSFVEITRTATLPRPSPSFFLQENIDQVMLVMSTATRLSGRGSPTRYRGGKPSPGPPHLNSSARRRKNRVLVSTQLKRVRRISEAAERVCSEKAEAIMGLPLTPVQVVPRIPPIPPKPSVAIPPEWIAKSQKRKKEIK